jgi:hypothetical protein
MLREAHKEMSETDSIENPLQYCIDIILKEAREEVRLVKQLLCTMLSAATNNPINLAINSPTGEGKTWVIQRVGEKFPKEDVMYLAGMTEKALFHRAGRLVVQNELGEYDPLDDKITKVDSEIEDKLREIEDTKDRLLRAGLKASIQNLEKDKKELQKNAKKLIDLSHKVLVFLDSPSPGLFNALMPLLSHDRYEVEYEFVDTHNGIKTKTNILRGWPAVIFAQAIDYSHYARYPEIQRRFIVTNPQMDAAKYSTAIDLIGDRFGLPDFAYQCKVVSDADKEQVQYIINKLKQEITEICKGVQAGKNNVIIPFYEVLTRTLPKEKAFDMTVANRFFAYLSLLPLINADKRPRLYLRTDVYPFLQTIPFALFEDLKEAVYLMRYANGVRPYVLEWYYKVFLEVYGEKTEPDSSLVMRGKQEVRLEEKREAVTSEELVKKTEQIYRKIYTKKNIVDHYVTPLINQGYMDSLESELDHRSNIYYPLINEEKNNHLGTWDPGAYLSEEGGTIVVDPTVFPDRDYIISKIHEILKYSNQNSQMKILDHLRQEISVEDLADKYYTSPEAYFIREEKK